MATASPPSTDERGETAQTPEERAELAAIRRARARVRAVRDFYGHLAVYLIVNTVLIVVDVAGGKEGETFLGLDWAFFPLIGWGIFVLIQAGATFWFEPSFGRSWRDRKFRQYLDEERVSERHRRRMDDGDEERR